MVLPAALVCLFFLVLVVAICNQGNPGFAATKVPTLVRKAAFSRPDDDDQSVSDQSGSEAAIGFQTANRDIDDQTPAAATIEKFQPDAAFNPPAGSIILLPDQDQTPNFSIDLESPSQILPSIPAGSPSPSPSPAPSPAAANRSVATDDDEQDQQQQQSLASILESAAMPNITPPAIDGKTVLVTELNSAWATGGMFDLFLRSFHTGDRIEHLLDHLVVATLDKESFRVCRSKNLHCVRIQSPLGLDLSSENKFMTPKYLETNKAKIQFLYEVLKLGYNFVYTDCDTLWFRSPFQHFSRTSDLDVSCNHDFTGNSSDLSNHINTGIMHIRSSDKTIKLFELWIDQHGSYPDKNDQDVFEAMKETPEFETLELKLRYVPTEYLSGYCRINADLEKICTMHAICCIGQDVKLAALQQTLGDWIASRSLTPQEVRETDFQFILPGCSM